MLLPKLQILVDKQMDREGRDLPERTEFFSFEASRITDNDGNESFIVEVNPHSNKSQNKTHDTTELNKEQKELFREMYQNSIANESCFEDFEEFIKKIPIQTSQELENLNISQNASFFKRKVHETPSSLIEKEKYVAKTNWLSELEVKCVIDYSNKKVPTICRIKDAQLQFENGCSFRLTKITKMKVLFQNYQKCIVFTYDDLRGKKTTEVRFKIYIENDMKDDLYILFAKIVVEKLVLLDFEINLKEGEDIEGDKFLMTGQVYKKGQVINQWNLRKLVLTDRIESFKDEKMTFQMTNIKQIWTRFEMYQKNLIIKIRHGKEKTELAIPLVNFPVRFCKDNWLFRIYRLLTTA